MIKPLLRIIPALSGNVKLVCPIIDVQSDNGKFYTANIRSAFLQPLSSSLYQRNIQANLLNSSYDYDLKKYYVWYSDIFYSSEFDYNKKEITYIDRTSVLYPRNTDFEYGVKRISYKKSGYQYACFAPIYIDDANDIPNDFIINITFKSENHITTKQIKVQIASEKNTGYLDYYLNKYLNKCDTDVIYMDGNNKTVTYFGIDLVNGGFTKSTDSTVQSLFDTQFPLQMFDETIIKGFERSKVAIKQIIPLCFLIDPYKLLNTTEYEKFSLGSVSFNCYYTDKNNNPIDFYDFDWDYDNWKQDVVLMNESNGVMSVRSGYKENIMDVGFPSFNDRWLDKWLFKNRSQADFCRWKLKYSTDDDPYIINLSWAMSANQNSNYKYKEFPAQYLQQDGYAILDSDNVYDLQFPLADGIVLYDMINKKSSEKYKNIMNNYCLNWFDVISEDDEKNIASNLDKVHWADVIDGYAYVNSILYNLNAVYNEIENMTDEDKIDKFGIVVVPRINELYDKEKIRDIKFVTYTFDTEGNINCTINDKLFNATDKLKQDDIKWFFGNKDLSKADTTSLTYDEIYTELTDQSYAGPRYINLYDLGIDFLQVNTLLNTDDVTTENIEEGSVFNNITNECSEENASDIDKAESAIKNVLTLVGISENDLLNSGKINKDYYDDTITAFGYTLTPEYRQEHCPTLFKDKIGIKLNEVLPIYRASEYVQNDKYIDGMKGYRIASVEDYKNIKTISDLSDVLSSEYINVLYGHVLYNKDNKYFVDQEVLESNYRSLNTMDIVTPFIDKDSTGKYNVQDIYVPDTATYNLVSNMLSIYNMIIDALIQDINDSYINNIKYAYYPELRYNDQTVASNCVMKLYQTSQEIGINSEDEIFVDDIATDNNVLYVHNRNIEKIAELIKKENPLYNIESAPYLNLYGQIINMNHYRLMKTNDTKFYKQQKALYNGELKFIYTEIDENDENGQLLFDESSGMFYYKNKPNDEFNVCEYTKFYKLGQDLWNLSNIDDSESKYFDMFIYRPCHQEEYDQKYGTKPIEVINTVIDESNIIVDSPQKMLFPCFDSEYVQERKQTIFYKNWTVNNILEVRIKDFDYTGTKINRSYNDSFNESFGNMFYVQTKTLYRYNTNNAAVYIRHDQPIEGIKQYIKKYDSEFVYSTSKDPLYSDYNIETFEVDGIKYGYYKICIDVNNTSSMFNVTGILDFDKDTDDMTDLSFAQNIKFLTKINGIDIIENPTYIISVFKQLCPFLNINLLNKIAESKIIMSPLPYNLTSVYSSQLLKNNCNERTLKYTKNTIASAKKQILQRYLGMIVPYIKKTEIVTDQYMLKYKDIQKSLLDTGNYPSIGDFSMYSQDIDINKYSPLRIYSSSTDIKEMYEQIEWKHYNDSKMILLPYTISIDTGKSYTYQELLEAESQDNVINEFSNYVLRKGDFDKWQILFLLNRYDILYETNPIGISMDGTEKTYSLIYKFKLK